MMEDVDLSSHVQMFLLRCLFLSLCLLIRCCYCLFVCLFACNNTICRFSLHEPHSVRICYMPTHLHFGALNLITLFPRR